MSTERNSTLQRRLQRARLARLLTELEREAGPIDPAVRAEVRRAWPAPGEATGMIPNG